jgi:hypothetical protein
VFSNTLGDENRVQKRSQRRESSDEELKFFREKKQRTLLKQYCLLVFVYAREELQLLKLKGVLQLENLQTVYR